MTARFATTEEILNWDSLIINNPDGGNILQTSEMAAVKQSDGWKLRYLIIESLAVSVQERYIFGLGKLWYIPKGPGVADIKQLKPLISELKKFAASKGVFLVKIEPEITDSKANLASLKRLGLMPAGVIQPNTSTVVLDLSPDTEQIMTNFPQKSRHAIKRAFREGMVAKQVEPTPKNIAIMLTLMKETAASNAIHMRPDQYYETFWKTFAANGMGQLFLAYDKKTPIAGAYVLVQGNKATYKDGGSVRKKTIYGASHALQWTIIEWLKTKQVTSYDLCGSPRASDIGNTDHPHYGIGLFKTSFNKTVTEFVGVFDIVIRKPQYVAWEKILQRTTFIYYRRVLNRYFY